MEMDELSDQLTAWVWANIAAVEDGEVLWTCGCVTELVNGDPQGFRHVDVSCEPHLSVWSLLGVSVGASFDAA